MPVVLLERVPFPSLQTYSAISAVLLSCAIFYAYQTVIGVNELTSPLSKHVGEMPTLQTPVESPKPEVVTENPDVGSVEPLVEPGEVNLTLPYDNVMMNVMFVLWSEMWCILTMVNTAYCCLILLGKVIQRLVFGSLRVMESQHLKDKFWNFLFYKFIFIFGVMNVQTVEEVVLWVAWFTMLGFLHLLTQLAKDRFEYLSFSPATPRITHGKLLALLFVLLCSTGNLIIISCLVGLQAGITIFAFLAAECFILGIRILHVLVRYVIHLWDMNTPSVWENRSLYVYYTELGFELAVLSVDFGHHLHMLLWGNIFLSMASLIICMQLRFLFYEFKRRLQRHKNYRRVVRNMEARFSMATQEDIQQNNDNCAVCWEKMDTARKLPCGHLFHNACLRSWLEQDTSCPTCRTSLNEGQDQDPNSNVPNERGAAPNVIPGVLPQHAANNQATTNHFFHFDGSRYVSWLPSFSVEVTHTQLMPGQRQATVQTSQLDSMAREVQSVFPHIPVNVIIDDLRVTHSVEFTIENILENRVQIPSPGTRVTRAAVEEIDNIVDDILDEADERDLPPPDQDTLLPSLITQTSTEDDQHLYQLAGPSQPANVPSAERHGIDLARGDGVATIMDENLPILHERLREQAPATVGGRFSKSATERQSMLQQRKNSMLEQARKKYMSKTESSDSDLDPPPGSSNASSVQHFANTRSQGEESVRRRQLFSQR
ncbi:hypothetical protein FSP39_014404 [Pinctada imbricata]|uniref:Autocrine motility factor receptor n=1 Tax=Pinctada imbricata TaxID=66713 RepID=A0AA88XRF9_PINIB|nr:hypothetical protein FSP39_014404 [Pinctada imbricata]